MNVIWSRSIDSSRDIRLPAHAVTLIREKTGKLMIEKRCPGKTIRRVNPISGIEQVMCHVAARRGRINCRVVVQNLR